MSKDVRAAVALLTRTVKVWRPGQPAVAVLDRVCEGNGTFNGFATAADAIQRHKGDPVAALAALRGDR